MKSSVGWFTFSMWGPGAPRLPWIVDATEQMKSTNSYFTAKQGRFLVILYKVRMYKTKTKNNNKNKKKQ